MKFLDKEFKKVDIAEMCTKMDKFMPIKKNDSQLVLE